MCDVAHSKNKMKCNHAITEHGGKEFKIYLNLPENFGGKVCDSIYSMFRAINKQVTN